MSLVKKDDYYYPNDKYLFVRRSIISYYSKCVNEEDIPGFNITDYMSFLEEMYQIYCNYKENMPNG